MKNRKLCLWMLLAAMLLTGCNKQEPEPSQTPATTVPAPEPPGIPVLGDPLPETIYTLTAAGSMAYQEGLLSLNGTLCLYDASDSQTPYRVLDADGKPVTGERYSSVVPLGSDLVAVAKPDGETQSWGLLRKDPAEVLLPCSATELRLLSSRYCRVFTATAQVSEEEPHFYYDSRAECYYTGNVQLLDLQTGKLVPDLILTDPEKSVEICGSLICVGSGGSFEVYRSDGTHAGSVTNAWIREDYILTHQAGQTVVYDGTLQELARLSYEAYPVDGSEQYLYRFDGNFYRQILDLKGNPVLPQSYKTVWQIHRQYAVVEQDGAYGVIRTDGTAVSAFAYSMILWQQDYHSFSMSDASGRKFVLMPGCPLLETTGLDGYGLYFFTVQNGTYSYRILFTGGVLESSGYAELLGDGMLVIGNELKETVRGTTLLSGYEDYLYTQDGYLYALKDGTWSIFRVQVDLP